MITQTRTTTKPKSEIQIQAEAYQKARNQSLWKKVGIYKITSPSGKVYIGQSRNIGKRVAAYKRGEYNKQPKLYNSMNKYGYANHSIEVICFAEICDLNKLEVYYISLHDSVIKGLNSTTGGDAKYSLSEESKQKIGRAHKGKKLSDTHKENLRLINTGKKYSPETKAKNSLRLLGNSHSLGYIHTQDTRQKMSLAKTGIIFSETSRKKISQKMKGNKNGINSRRKEIIDTSSGIIYRSITEAAEQLGYKPKSLNNMLTGFRKNKTNLQYV